jgi:hypothetical protein
MKFDEVRNMNETLEIVEIKRERFLMKCQKCGLISEYNPCSPRGRLNCMSCWIPMDYL